MKGKLPEVVGTLFVPLFVVIGETILLKLTGKPLMHRVYQRFFLFFSGFSLKGRENGKNGQSHRTGVNNKWNDENWGVAVCG